MRTVRLTEVKKFFNSKSEEPDSNPGMSDTKPHTLRHHTSFLSGGYSAQKMCSGWC